MKKSFARFLWDNSFGWIEVVDISIVVMWTWMALLIIYFELIIEFLRRSKKAMIPLLIIILIVLIIVGLISWVKKQRSKYNSLYKNIKKEHTDLCIRDQFGHGIYLYQNISEGSEAPALARKIFNDVLCYQQ